MGKNRLRGCLRIKTPLWGQNQMGKNFQKRTETKCPSGLTRAQSGHFGVSGRIRGPPKKRLVCLSAVYWLVSTHFSDRIWDEWWDRLFSLSLRGLVSLHFARTGRFRTKICPPGTKWGHDWSNCPRNPALNPLDHVFFLINPKIDTGLTGRA